jgi:hypothetical protein
VTVSFTDANGNLQTATSIPTSAVQENPKETITVIVEGLPAEGDQLLATVINGDAPASGISYVWQTSIDGRNWTTEQSAVDNNSFVPGAADVGKQLRVQVSFTDSAGNLETATTSVTDVITGPGLLTTAPVDTVYYSVTDLDTNTVGFRGTSNSLGQFNFFGPSQAPVLLQAFDPGALTYGETVILTPASGQSSELGPDDLTLVPISTLGQLPMAADGLPVAVDQIVGADPNVIDNFVPGMSDLAALQQGLVSASSLVNTTGVVASLPLQGEARSVILTGSTTNSSQQTAYIATGSYGLAIVDASNFQKPVVLGQIKLPGMATDAAVDTTLGLAAVATGAGGLQIVNVADPTKPTLVETIPIDATQVQIVDGIAYANNGSSLDAFDLATGAEFQTVPLGGTTLTGMVRDGTMLYTMDSSHTLRTIDTSSGQMVLDGAITLPYGGNRIFGANGVVYVGAEDQTTAGGYLTVDVSNPSTPKLIEGPDNRGIAGAALALNGSGLGVSVEAGLSAGGPVNIFSVFGASDPTKTGQFITQYNLPSQPYDVAIGDGIAFVADGTSGLQVVNYRSFDTAGVPPTIQITQEPTDVDPNTPGIQVYEGEAVTIGVNVTDDVQVRDVELLVDGQVVNNQVSYPWQLSAIMPTIAANGSDQVTLQVEAIDTGGNTTLSNSIQVQLVPDPTPPRLIGQSVSEGQIVGTLDRSFTFNFSKPLDPMTVTASSFMLIGPNGIALVPASIESRDGNRQVEVTYNILTPGQYHLEIDASRVTDGSGNPLGASLLTTDLTVEQFTDEWIDVGATGDWNDPSNWSTDAVPGPQDDVLVNLPLGATAIFGGGSDTISQLVTTGTGTLVATGGTLTVTGITEIGGSLDITGGTFVADGATTVNDLVLSAGTLSGSGTVTIGLRMTWSGGQMLGSGTTVLGSGATLTERQRYTGTRVAAIERQCGAGCERRSAQPVQRHTPRRRRHAHDSERRRCLYRRPWQRVRRDRHAVEYRRLCDRSRQHGADAARHDRQQRQYPAQLGQRPDHPLH